MTARKRGQTWTDQVYVGRDPATGKKRYKAVTAPTKLAAEGLAHDMRKALAAGRSLDHGAETVGALLDEWLAVADHEASTRGQTRYVVDRLILPYLAATRVDRLAPQQITQWMTKLRRGGGVDGKPLGDASVLRAFGVLKAACNLAVEWDWIARNPCDRARKPSVPVPDPQPPTADDVRTLIDGARYGCVDDDGNETLRPNPDLAVFVRLAAVTGARRGELLALRRSSFDGTTIAIKGAVGTRHRTDGEKGGGYLKGTKTGDRHRLALDPATCETLAGLFERQNDDARADGIDLDPDPYLFSADPQLSTFLYPTTVSHDFRDLARACGIDTNLRSLRHFAATSMLSSGVSVKAVAGRLGHRRTSTTLEHYAAWQLPDDAAAAGGLGALLD